MSSFPTSGLSLLGVSFLGVPFLGVFLLGVVIAFSFDNPTTSSSTSRSSLRFISSLSPSSYMTLYHLCSSSNSVTVPL